MTLKEFIKKHQKKLTWILLILVFIKLAWHGFAFINTLRLSSSLTGFNTIYFSSMFLLFVILYILFSIFVIKKKTAGYYGIFILALIEMLITPHGIMWGIFNLISSLQTLLPLSILILSGLFIYAHKKEPKKPASLLKVLLIVTVVVFLLTIIFSKQTVPSLIELLISNDFVAKSTFESLINGWLMILIPLLIMFTLGTLFLRSKLKPKLAFLLPAIAIPLFSLITWIEFRYIFTFSGEMVWYGFIVYMLFGNLIFLVFSIIYAVVLCKKKTRISGYAVLQDVLI